MNSSLARTIMILGGFLAIILFSYFLGYLAGLIEHHTGQYDQLFFLKTLKPLIFMLLIGAGSYMIFRQNKSGFAQYKSIFLRLGALFVAGIVAAVSVAIWSEGGISIWLVPAFILIGGFVWLAFRPAAEGSASELQDLLMGDMTDPKQRNIMIRTVIAITPHMWLATILLDGKMTTIRFDDGLAQAEMLTIAAIIGFFATLVWLVYECKLYFQMDDYIKQLYTGPLLAGLCVYIGLLIMNDIVVRHFGLSGATPYWKYLSVWLVSGLFMVVASIRATDDEQE